MYSFILFIYLFWGEVGGVGYYIMIYTHFSPNKIVRLQPCVFLHKAAIFRYVGFKNCQYLYIKKNPKQCMHISQNKL